MRAHLQRRGDELIGLARLAALQPHHAEQMQRIEHVGMGFEDAAVELVRLGKTPGAVQRQRLVDRIVETERGRKRFRHAGPMRCVDRRRGFSHSRQAFRQRHAEPLERRGQGAADLLVSRSRHRRIGRRNYIPSR